MIKLDNIQDAIDDFRQGKMVIVVDDEDRENEGDLIARRRKNNPRAGQLHAQKRARRIVRTHHPVALPRARTAAPGRAEHVDARHTLYGDCRQARGLHHRRQCRGPLRHHPRTCRPWARPPRPSAAPDISTRSMRRMPACCAARATPRLLSTWHVWPVCNLLLP